jgi:hypothetical protein
MQERVGFFFSNFRFISTKQKTNAIKFCVQWLVSSYYHKRSKWTCYSSCTNFYDKIKSLLLPIPRMFFRLMSIKEGNWIWNPEYMLGRMSKSSRWHYLQHLLRVLWTMWTQWLYMRLILPIRLSESLDRWTESDDISYGRYAVGGYQKRVSFRRSDY